MTAADRIRDYLDALAELYDHPRNVAIHTVRRDGIDHTVGSDDPRATDHTVGSDDLRVVLAELDEARAKLARVEALHVSDDVTINPFCAVCWCVWPCATLQAVGGTP